jgi:hypothetical protein
MGTPLRGMGTPLHLYMHTSMGTPLTTSGSKSGVKGKKNIYKKICYFILISCAYVRGGNFVVVQLE